MLQVRRGADLGQEALRAKCGGEVGVQHLQRHVARVPDVAGEVDGGHPTGAGFAFDLVAVAEGVCERGPFSHQCAGLRDADDADRANIRGRDRGVNHRGRRGMR